MQSNIALNEHRAHVQVCRTCDDKAETVGWLALRRVTAKPKAALTAFLQQVAKAFVLHGWRAQHLKLVEPNFLSNAAIVELLAVAAETAKMPLQKALRRASRKAFMWEEEAAPMFSEGRSLTELPAIGTSLDRIIRRWIEDPPNIPSPPPIRRGFLTLPEARSVVDKHPSMRVRGDLQMHTEWSDGSGTVEDMAKAASDRGYEYTAITDHSKGLKIAGGITEAQLQQQGEEIEQVNAKFRSAGLEVRVLRSIELNLDPHGNGDMEPESLDNLDLVLGCFHSALRKKEDQTERYVAALRNPDIQILGHPRGRIYNYRLGLQADWTRVSTWPLNSIKPSRSMATRIGRT